MVAKSLSPTSRYCWIPSLKSSALKMAVIKTIVTRSPTMFWLCVVVGPSIFANRCTSWAVAAQTTDVIFSLQLGVHFCVFWNGVKAVMGSVWIVRSHGRPSHVKREFRHLQDVAVLIFGRQWRRRFDRQNILVLFCISV